MTTSTSVSPRHRGSVGGKECRDAFYKLMHAIQHDYRSHDPLIQALALQYHFGAMHPFGDGNGRTARVLEALILHRAGLRDTAFIPMSNYYYEEKPVYLGVLAKGGALNHDLTPFLIFGLRGVAEQCGRLLQEIKRSVQKAIFRDMAIDLFGRLRSPRKRVIAERQLGVLRILLDVDRIELGQLADRTFHLYSGLTDPLRGLYRDLNALFFLGAIDITERQKGFEISAKLEWPTEMKESELFNRVNKMPRAKTPRRLFG
jgi:hypothetical protein